MEFEGHSIVPIQFLKALLPDPASLGPRTVGKTNIGCIFTGVKDGVEKKAYIYNVCDHQACYREVGSQAISYTTGVPAMVGAMMLLTGKWSKPGRLHGGGVDPDPYMDALNQWGPALAGGRQPPCWWTEPWLRYRTPYFLVDEGRLLRNLELLQAVQERAGCRILLAQKAFSMFYAYPLLRRYLAGTAASGLYEARLGHEEFGGETHVFSPAYRPEEFPELLRYADHIVCNSTRPGGAVRPGLPGRRESRWGLRLNPACSTQAGHAIYDPCAPGSRLGTTLENFRPEQLPLLDGFHFHTLCEQDADAPGNYGGGRGNGSSARGCGRCGGLNLGGGHHITRPGYQVERLIALIRRLRETYGVEVYLEPGEAVVLNAGFLVDVGAGHPAQRGGHRHSRRPRRPATCRMCWKMPYRPPLQGAGGTGGKAVIPGGWPGPPAWPGTSSGDYSFDSPLRPVGTGWCLRIWPLYTMVKTNTFNGDAAACHGLAGQPWTGNPGARLWLRGVPEPPLIETKSPRTWSAGFSPRLWRGSAAQAFGVAAAEAVIWEGTPQRRDDRIQCCASCRCRPQCTRR